MGRKPKKKQTDTEVDLTPMIDVVFQLIMFFIVTVNLDQQSVLEKITLPDAKNSIESKEKDPRQVTIQVSKVGNFYIGTRQYTIRQLRQVLINTVRTAGGAQNVPILIRGDTSTAHRYIRQAMDTCAELGCYKIRFAGMISTAQQQPNM